MVEIDGIKIEATDNIGLVGETLQKAIGRGLETIEVWNTVKKRQYRGASASLFLLQFFQLQLRQALGYVCCKYATDVSIGEMGQVRERIMQTDFMRLIYIRKAGLT